MSDRENDDNTRTHIVLKNGTMVTHYKIVEKIGAGGMGEVFLAEDTKLKRQVALKFMPTHLVLDDEMRTRFIREAQAMALLDHPNIVPVYEVGEFQGCPFFAMAHIEGKSLSEIIRDRKLSVSEAINLMCQICEGLEKAHNAGVVHRDIKPGNIIIDSSNRVRLLDFGLSTISGTETLTQAGTMLGTVGYMSPEQIRGDEVDARSDLFSVGVVVYEMISGHQPFKKEHAGASLHAILDSTPELLAKHTSGIPNYLQQIVSKLLEKDRSLRFQTATDILRELDSTNVSTTEQSDPVSGIKNYKKMIVVLPFENLGPTEEEYFADGMTEEIISRLATIRKLGVISRTSTMTYKGTNKSIREIGLELGVDYVLEGSVRWNRKGNNVDRVRITQQLIRVSDDTHLWSDRFDRTLDDIFDVQSQIAEHVVDQLNIQLLGTEQNMLQAKPTDNLEAYQYYLQGLEFASRPDYARKDFQTAEKMFTKAVSLDPEFALAFADLSRTHSLMYFHGYDRSSDRANSAKSAAEQARLLNPDLAEVYLALGYFHYYCELNFELAFKDLEKVKHQRPNDSRMLFLTGAIVKRQGKISEAIDYYKQAFETSPRDASLLHEIGCAYMTMHNYSKAMHYYDLSISLSNNQVSVFVCKARNHFLWNGNIEEGQKVLTEIPGGVKDLFEVYNGHMLSRDYELALKTLTNAPKINDLNQWWYIPKAQFEGYALQLLDKKDEAVIRYQSALEILEEEVKKRPEDDRVHASLGIVHASLGNRESAIREAKLAVELVPVSKNAVVGPFRVEDLAFTNTLLGNKDDAIDQLENLLSIPSWFSSSMLRIDPRWDSLRDHPRFKKLIEKYEQQ